MPSNPCQTDRQTENYRGPQIAASMERRGYAGQYNNSPKELKGSLQNTEEQSEEYNAIKS